MIICDAKLYLKCFSREQFDSILDQCVSNYREQLDKERQIKFKNRARAFLRSYNYISSVVAYKIIAWEELSIFLNFLLLKLPPVLEEDLSKGILETIGLDSYRIEVKAQMAFSLPDETGTLKAYSDIYAEYKKKSKLAPLSSIVRARARADLLRFIR